MVRHHTLGKPFLCYVDAEYSSKNKFEVMSPGTLYLVAWKFLWAVLLLYSVREVVGDTKHKIVCSIKNNQDPRNYLEKDVVDIAMKNITIHKGHSSNSWQVLNCTCEDKRVSLYFKVCITKFIPF